MKTYRKRFVVVLIKEPVNIGMYKKDFFPHKYAYRADAVTRVRLVKQYGGEAEIKEE